MEDEMEICSNCKREIPSINYVTHSVHCHRNIAVCSKCKEPVPRSELAEHEEREHSNVPCPACGKQVENNKLQTHQGESCPLRRVSCSFCDLDMGASEQAEHENYCGSRTERCEECGEFVMLKYRTLHLDSNHGFLKLSDEPGPPASWEPPKVMPPLRPALKSSVNRPAVPTVAATQSTLGPKVPNTVRFSSQVEARKPSPVKRDNHQPQLNTKQQVSEKNSTAIPEALIDEDLDRLLALRLTQEDKALRLAQDDIEMFSQHNVLHYELPRPSILTDSDDDEELAAAMGLPPAVPTNQMEDEVQLPCEFCECPIPASRLVLHQTGCRPDLARYQPRMRPPSSPPGPLSRVHNNLTEEPRRRRPFTGQTERDMIPCDLCDTSVPAATFMQHQLACEIHHLPGRQPDRPQALVMPLSGRELKVRQPVPQLNYVLPGRNEPSRNFNQGQSEKTTQKQALPGAAGETAQNGSSRGSTQLTANGGALPKQKAKSSKKHRAPPPPPQL